MQEYGDPEIWATVEWGGSIRKSRKIKRLQLNENFHFQLSIAEKDLKKKSKKADVVEMYLTELR